jgi:hypothetical protein
VASFKKNLAVAKRKVKDATDDLQAMVESKFARFLAVDSMHLLGPFLIFRPWMSSGTKETEDALEKELVETKDQVKILKGRTVEVWEGE